MRDYRKSIEDREAQEAALVAIPKPVQTMIINDKPQITPKSPERYCNEKKKEIASEESCSS